MNLNQITIGVKDVQQSIEFYEKLGLKLIVKDLPHYARFDCRSSTFSLHLDESVVAQYPGAWVYFENENLDQIVIELQDKGLVFEEMPEDKPWLWREARLRDPDNNVVILYYAGENRLNPPWRIQ